MTSPGCLRGISPFTCSDKIPDLSLLPQTLSQCSPPSPMIMPCFQLLRAKPGGVIFYSHFSLPPHNQSINQSSPIASPFKIYPECNRSLLLLLLTWSKPPSFLTQISLLTASVFVSWVIFPSGSLSYPTAYKSDHVTPPRKSL